MATPLGTLRKLAAKGKSISEAAKIVGCTYAQVYVPAKRHGIAFRAADPRENKQQVLRRDQIAEIVRRASAGEKQADLAREFGITKAVVGYHLAYAGLQRKRLASDANKDILAAVKALAKKYGVSTTAIVSRIQTLRIDGKL